MLQPNEVPQLNWWQSLFRRRSLLQYYLGQDLHQVWVMKFEEKSDNCLVFQDYQTKQITMVKSDRPITYTLTEMP